MHLVLFNLQNPEPDLAIGSFSLHDIAGLVIHQSPPNGGFVRNLAFAWISLLGANDIIRLRVVIIFLDGHA